MILGISLGVAVAVAIDLANASANRAFDLGTEMVAGRATHQILGGPKGLDESIYIDLKQQGVVSTIAPIILDYVSSPQMGDLPLTLLGIDPLADAPFRSHLGGENMRPLNELVDFLTQPGAILISNSMAERYEIEMGEEIQLDIGDREQQAIVVGFVEPLADYERRALEGILLMDIASAQEMTGKIGTLDRIDLILPEDSGQKAALEDWLPESIRLVTSEARQGAVEQMTSAFRLNLQALSLLALVVGIFLIFNTMTFSVVQRRYLFGALRSLGVTRGEIFALVIGEAFLVGIIGGVLGLGLGVLLGRNSIRLVSQTINDLYFTTTVQSVGIPAWSLVKGGIASVLATMLAAVFPAWEAAFSTPRRALMRSRLESQTRRLLGWVALGGGLLMALGAVVFLVLPPYLIYSLVGTLLVVLGFAMLAPLMLLLLTHLFTPLTGRLFGFLGRMGPRSLVAALSRTSVTVASLMVAISVSIGVSIMIESFRQTVNVWLEEILQGDIYISVPGYTSNRSMLEIDPMVIERVESWDGVDKLFTLRTVMVDSGEDPVSLSAVYNPGVGEERPIIWSENRPEDIWGAMQAGSVMLTEPLAYRLDLLAPGSVITLNTDRGLHTFPVEGVYYDYTSSEGGILMAMDVYRSYWQDDGITSLDLRLLLGVNPEVLTKKLQNDLSEIQSLEIRPNRSLRRDVLEVFDRTFAITVSLRVLTTIVAFIGILNTLLLLQFEKQRELGILRALGLTGRQLFGLTMLETGLIGLISGILAAPAGYMLALILVDVINRRSFGWTLRLAVSPGDFIQAILLAILASLLAGIYPALRLNRMAASDAIRFE